MRQSLKYLTLSIRNFLKENGSLILACVLMGALHLLYQGYNFGSGNHSIQIPILKSYFHPDLYPGDRMIATRSHFITFYFMFLGLLDRIFGHLEFIFFTSQLLTEILIFFTAYHFAYALFKDKKIAIMPMILFFTNKPVLGGAIIHWNYHTHTYAVLPLILVAFALYVYGYRKAAYGLLGFAANINIQSVSFVLPMFMLFSLIKAYESGKENNWLSAGLNLAKEYGFFIVFSLPCLIWAFSKAGGNLTEDWFKQLWERSRHHSYPFTWEKKHFTDNLLFFTLGILTWSIALKNSERKNVHGMIGWFSFVVLLLCSAGVVFAEYIPLKIVLRAQLFRSTKFLSIFVLLYVSYAAKYLWDKGNFHRILAIATFIPVLITDYLIFIPLIILIYQITERKDMYWWTTPVVASVLILRVYVPHTGFPSGFDSSKMIGFIRPFFEDKIRVQLSVALLLWLSVISITSNRWLKSGVALIILLFFSIKIYPVMYHSKVTTVENRGTWVDVQLWAKENTPKSAMFLTPPYNHYFRVYSERSTVGEWKDGTQQYFDTEYSYEWWSRMMDIGKNEAEYDNLKPERLKELSEKYSVSYIVFRANKPLPFDEVYKNKDYIVYKIYKHKI
ncbi:hypothetical protein GF312_06225 [Candidatus Poribacteria bacterium]|nr:hypothetical protein [Candidatus Poribacteria bacterium]